MVRSTKSAKATRPVQNPASSPSREFPSSQGGSNDNSELPSSENEDTDDANVSVDQDETNDDDFDEGMDREGYAGPSSKVVKPLTPEGLAAFNAEIARTGVVYISRIPPGMRAEKVRHLMSQYGEVGRVYLQKEDPKTTYLRRKHTTDKKPHFIEGWVEFKDKKVARTVATMLNAQSIGGKKGTRWRDDVWTMTYLPKFKWNMLTEQIAHEAAARAAKLRVEITQSRSEQNEYLRNVELARIVDKRNEKRKEKEKREKRPPVDDDTREKRKKRPRVDDDARNAQLQDVLGSIF
ncbi:hypothetical protein EDC04DRAFT_2752317 [Pisolithus marmoratus]|nr:hypothetical protein EDC04DRAFT_2752317 [Pisolithus marmoratus]